MKYGRWVRCKVSQPGGTGVLERLNRTFKSPFAFRHDGQSMAEVRAAMPEFHRWYNHERRHSALGNRTPWSTLTSSANARGRRLKPNLEHDQENVEHETVLVHRSPEPLSDAIDARTDLVRKPAGTPVGFALAQVVREERVEFDAHILDRPGHSGEGGATATRRAG